MIFGTGKSSTNSARFVLLVKPNKTPLDIYCVAEELVTHGVPPWMISVIEETHNSASMSSWENLTNTLWIYDGR